ncbi:DUF4956 domain-containing protein [Alkaliphilus hydrothermalis]|uniref:Membrane protein YhiD involved in acid resistance n=1 Tax=Alkaliphilus hydrothermalis TaxID=1482730 RepID=A0ABS2NKQ3_9FIRM|nr:DUF4956 domain-containing protein [Alkaliphilus hydrothermalis]MBM7613513.1 putative membrane protein YhiD involved in acid resistance [Alkaliphilus hydrothermalis]
MKKVMDQLMEQEILFTLFGGTDFFTMEKIIFNLVVATLLGLFIYFVYKKTFSGVMYSQNFNVTIVMICIITAIVMMLIGKNLSLSLGLVGSLSIIRFRTTIKDPRDIGFIFWAITVGLAAGTNEFIVAIIGSIIIALILFIFNRVIYMDYCYLLVLKGTEIEAKEIGRILKEYKIPFKLKMKNTNSLFMETTYEISLKSVSEDTVIKTFRGLEGIEEVHIVNYNGEVSG